MRMPDFRRFIFAAGAVCLLLGTLGGPAEAKPLPPVSVFWQVDSTAGADGDYGVALTVLARSDFPDLAVEFALPAGFSVLDGDLTWAGSMARDETRTFRVRVHAPAPGTVSARVSGGTASNVQFSRTVSVDVPEPKNEPATSGKADATREGMSAEPAPRVREFPSR
jgi:hypothetical protein